MDIGIREKRALVLASSAGLGKAIAQALAAEGAKVILSGRKEETLSEVASEIGAEGYIVFDLSEVEAGKRLVEICKTQFGEIDILVTNAGGPPKGAFLEVTNDAWQTGFQSLFLGFVDTVRSVLPGMCERSWGRILAVTSIAGKEPITDLTISNGIRAGLHGLVNSLSKEVASCNVSVNALLPTFTETDRLVELGVTLEDLAERVPAKRLGRPEELGKLAAFLCSEHAGFITGQAIAYDGGSLRGI